MQRVKIDLADHRSRPLTDQVLEISDLILTMTSSHMEIIRLQNPGPATPGYRFREWMPPGSQEVPDPFGGSLQTYVDTRDALAEAIPSVLEFLKTHIEK